MVLTRCQYTNESKSYTNATRDRTLGDSLHGHSIATISAKCIFSTHGLYVPTTRKVSNKITE